MAAPFGSASTGFGKPGGFGFGTPQPASGGLFGGSSTPAIGFGATSTAPAFGASPAPAFGAAFSFSGASAPAQAAPAFGAAQTAPAGGLFSASSTPLLGSTGTTSSPGLFGAPAQASTAAGFSFASSPSLFGSPAPNAFGSTGQAAALNMFGAPQQQQQMAPVAFSSGFAPDAAVKEMGEVRAAYTPSSPTFKFQHLFLNVVEDPAQRVKPANVDEIRWRQVLAQAGGPNNADKLWPVLAVGFKDLLTRAAAQQQAIQENQNRLKSLTELAHRMARQHSGDLKSRTNDVQKRHIELSNRLLHVTRLLDSLESRLAGSLGYHGDQSRAKEQELSRHLSSVEAELNPSSSSALQRRLEAVAASARLRAGGAGAGSAAASAQTKLDENSLQQLFAVLKEHAEGVKHLQEVLKRDQLDVQIMRQQLS